MDDFARELAMRIGATQRSLEAEGATPLDGTTRTIRRKRAVRQGTTAGVAVIAIGALAATGTLAVRRALDAQPAAYDLPPGGGEVSIPVDGPNPTIPRLNIECGDPAPEPLLKADGYRIEVAETETVGADYTYDNVVWGRVNAFDDNVETTPAFLLHPTVVMVQDGTVVGVGESGGLYNRVFFTPGRGSLTEGFDVGDFMNCPNEPHARLEPGDYEYYVVANIANSPEIAALSRVSNAYSGGPWFNEDRWLEPTDWECSNTLYWGELPPDPGSFSGSSAAACFPAQDSRVVWDADARALVLPYSDSIVRRVFTTELIAGPFDFTVVERNFPTFDSADLPDSLPTDPPTACNAEVGWFEEPNSVGVYSPEITAAGLARDATIDAVVWPEFGPDTGNEGRVATLRAPGVGRAFITVYRDEFMEEYDIHRGFQAVVGEARVTVNDGDDITVSRALGPAAVQIRFDDVTWCDGAPPQEELSVTVASELILNSESGSKTFEVYTINPGSVTG